MLFHSPVFVSRLKCACYTYEDGYFEAMREAGAIITITTTTIIIIIYKSKCKYTDEEAVTKSKKRKKIKCQQMYRFILMSLFLLTM